MKYLNLFNYIRWASELAEFWSIRRSPIEFVALSRSDGVKYVSLPKRVKPTKSHQWWVMLGALLRCFKPEAILELGSGRSTIYLSEYACKEGKFLLSVDESPEWVAANALIARFGSLPSDFIHHVPLGDDGYYDITALKRLIERTPEFDFVYLDGPIKNRSGALEYKLINEVISGADVIVIDDIQWGHVYDQMDTFQNLGMPRDRLIIEYFLDRPAANFLCVLSSHKHRFQLGEIIRCLNIDTVDNYTRERCTKY